MFLVFKGSVIIIIVGDMKIVVLKRVEVKGFWNII